MEKKKTQKKYSIYVFPASGINLSSGITLYEWCKFCGEKQFRDDIEYIKTKKEKLYSLSSIISYICTELGYSLVSFTRWENLYYVTFLKD